MRKLIRWILLAGLVAGISWGPAWAAETAPKGPVAVVKTEVFDFGSVYAGKDVIHSFEIENAGDAPLVIKDVRTG